MRVLKMVRGLVAVGAVAAFATLPAASSGEQSLCTPYENYKIDVSFWPDPKGHTSYFLPPSGDWEWVSQFIGKDNPHNDFRSGYADDHHTSCP